MWSPHAVCRLGLQLSQASPRLTVRADPAYVEEHRQLCRLVPKLAGGTPKDIHKELGPVIYNIMGKTIFGGEWLKGEGYCVQWNGLAITYTSF
jgi:hypothetical protein